MCCLSRSKDRYGPFVRRFKLDELALVAAFLIAAAAFFFKGDLPGIICLVLAVYAALVFWTPLRAYLGLPSRYSNMELPLANRLKLKLKEGQALVPRLGGGFPDIEVLKLARAWQIEVYRMLVGQRKDLAQKFLDGADPIEEREAQSLATANPASFILEEHTTCLEGLIREV